jgi:integrase
MALMTGMRKGEILALQWKDIDFETDTIRVTKSVSHSGDRPSIKQPKTEAGNRVVPLLAPLKDKLQTVPKHKQTDYIISDNGKEPLSNSRYCTLMSHYQKETGVTCTAHQLRHSFATIAFEADLDPKTVQEILGHKQLSTTMDIYTSFREKALKSAAQKLNNIM